MAKYYADALAANGISYLTWDIRADKDLGLNYTKSFKKIVWFTGNSYPAPVTPYEAALKGFLDNGGRLFMSGQDILDQGAGTTAFVHDYLHIDWDGSETQNDKATAAVHGVAGNPVSNGIGTVPLDHSVLGGATFEDRINPINGALNAFTDDTTVANALSFSSTYKVVFLAFPFEAYGTAATEDRPDQSHVHVLRGSLVGHEDGTERKGRLRAALPFPARFGQRLDRAQFAG